MKVEIIKEEPYRSKSLVNMPDNMVRVTFTCSRNEWRGIKRHLTNAIDSDGEGRCVLDGILLGEWIKRMILW